MNLHQCLSIQEYAQFTFDWLACCLSFDRFRPRASKYICRSFVRRLSLLEFRPTPDTDGYYEKSNTGFADDLRSSGLKLFDELLCFTSDELLVLLSLKNPKRIKELFRLNLNLLEHQVPGQITINWNPGDIYNVYVHKNLLFVMTNNGYVLVFDYKKHSLKKFFILPGNHLDFRIVDDHIVIISHTRKTADDVAELLDNDCLYVDDIDIPGIPDVRGKTISQEESDVLCAQYQPVIRRWLIDRIDADDALETIIIDGKKVVIPWKNVILPEIAFPIGSTHLSAVPRESLNNWPLSPSPFPQGARGVGIAQYAGKDYVINQMFPKDNYEDLFRRTYILRLSLNDPGQFDITSVWGGNHVFYLSDRDLFLFSHDLLNNHEAEVSLANADNHDKHNLHSYTVIHRIHLEDVKYKCSAIIAGKVDHALAINEDVHKKKLYVISDCSFDQAETHCARLTILDCDTLRSFDIDIPDGIQKNSDVLKSFLVGERLMIYRAFEPLNEQYTYMDMRIIQEPAYKIAGFAIHKEGRTIRQLLHPLSDGMFLSLDIDCEMLSDNSRYTLVARLMTWKDDQTAVLDQKNIFSVITAQNTGGIRHDAAWIHCDKATGWTLVQYLYWIKGAPHCEYASFRVSRKDGIYYIATHEHRSIDDKCPYSLESTCLYLPKSSPDDVYACSASRDSIRIVSLNPKKLDWRTLRIQ